MPNASGQDPVEANALRLLEVMVEQNIRDCRNTDLQRLTGIEDLYDVNDALEWLDERGAIYVSWLQDAAGPSHGHVILKGKGKSLYHSHKQHAQPSQDAAPVFNTNFSGPVGNAAIGGQHFEQHTTMQSSGTPGAQTPSHVSSNPATELAEEPMSTNKPPRAMISYAWEDEEHKRWVRTLGAKLRAEGVDVTLDQWHTAPGDQLPHFMETAIRENDYILIICTPAYKKKADQRLGGVGYEGDIMTGEVVNAQNQRKFIPILRKGDWKISLPSWMGGKYGIDLRGDPYSEDSYNDLLVTLHQLREEAPPLGTIPPRLIKPAP